MLLRDFDEAVTKMVAPREEVSRFVTDALRTVGAHDENAQQLADVLLDADYKGHFSHGINRLGELTMAKLYLKFLDPQSSSDL